MMNKECCMCGKTNDNEYITIRGKNGELSFCPEHITEGLTKALKLKMFNGCHICCDGNEDGFYAVDTGNHKLLLCKKHLIDMVCRCLDSEVFMNMYDTLGAEKTGLKLYNEEYYEEDGSAIEPMYELTRYYYSQEKIDPRENIIVNLISELYSIQADCRKNGINDRKTQQLFEHLMNSIETVEKNMTLEQI